MKQTPEWKRYLELVKERPECFCNTGPIQIVTDWVIVSEFQERTGKTIGVCYESRFNMLVVDLVYECDGKYFAYERLLPAVRKGAVVCVPIYGDKYILLKQYRHAMRNFQYAFPRGYAERNASAKENACKEIGEELGAKTGEMQHVGCVVADSGISGQTVDIFQCEILNYQIQENHEGIVDAVVVTGEELTDMICNKEISDGFTLAAYSYLRAKNILVTSSD